ncbi:hypothetical protein DNTS_031469 [Danionella cerebrum]|uniref:MADS-box domain-containing protein n=1 Tax=Danionella cerebrum TaxID=2873325 RepID=A0A553Q9W5_9TELE|nr:hypothetical protein DNTS_031469 [Danionella translucida]TRY86719.1 hypothetical protein DNTS_031469 [Danionella translucida]TRY86720.1 hypothetical protein DNTS_031469 [Danionella translucida]
MGRKKIQISRIMDERNRQVTFTKRKFGLMKKAYELSVLCDCEIALIIFNTSNKLFQYASTDMDKILLKYTAYNEPHESRTNEDIVDVLNKKEHRTCESPDPETFFALTPHTEEKYHKINEEFENMMRNHTIPFSMPLSLPVTSPATDVSYKTGSSLDTPGAFIVTNTLSVSSNGTECLDEMPGCSEVTLTNGVHSGHLVNGFGGDSEGNRVGRGASAKPQVLSTLSRKPELKLLIPSLSKSSSGSSPKIDSSESSQSLSTPVVSVATPSLHPQGLVYSSLPTDISLCSTVSSCLHGFTISPNDPEASWKPPVFGAQRIQSCDSSTNSNNNIKLEPVSPARDQHHTSPPPVSRQEVNSTSSSCPSFEVQHLTPTGAGRKPSSSSSSAVETEPESLEEPRAKHSRTDLWEA